MLSLAPYRRRPTRLADYLPWACLVGPGIVLNKDGSFQRSFRIRGKDLDSASDGELLAAATRLNAILKSFGEGWALFCDSARVPATGYPASAFPDPASWLVDEERRAAFESKGSHFETRSVLTLLHLPPPDASRASERFFYERKGGRAIAADMHAELAHFVSETDRAAAMLAVLLPEATPLDDAETLAYLHATISDKSHPVALPATPAYLDALLADTPLLGGIEPRLGNLTLRLLTVTGFPSLTSPGLADGLNDLGFPFRVMTRFIPLSVSEATRQLTKLRRHWFAKRKSVAAVLREVMFNRETALVDPDAEAKAADADSALAELGSGEVAFGYLTQTLLVADSDPARADEKLIAIEAFLNGRGLLTIRESLNAVEAWLGTLPGNPYANVRQPIVHTLNLVHMLPLAARWAGPETNAHLNAPPLMLTRTRGTTPFRLDLHVGDVGHSLIVGPTGAGKSVLIACLALQFRRYANAQVAIFDKGRSARAAVLAMNGTSIDLGLDGSLALQPLRAIDDAAGLARAQQWLLTLLANEKVALTPKLKDGLWSALKSLASAPAEERTLTGLAVLVDDRLIADALSPYTLEGPFGRLLDGCNDGLALADVVHLEMAGLMHHPPLLLPVLTHLFDRLEQRFDGRPSLLILDEAWVFLDSPVFAPRLREWLKSLRKKNVAVVFATQSLDDIERASIAPALIESCPTRIFLANERALEPQAAVVYRRFGLNPRQIELIASATPKRDYYADCPRGNRLFELGLGPIALAFAAAASSDQQRQIDELLATASGGFAARWLRRNGLDWAAELIEDDQTPAPASAAVHTLRLPAPLLAAADASPIARRFAPAANEA